VYDLERISISLGKAVLQKQITPEIIDLFFNQWLSGRKSLLITATQTSLDDGNYVNIVCFCDHLDGGME
jgi:hypothetical protein